MIFDTSILFYLSNSKLSLDKMFPTAAKIPVITKIKALGYAFKQSKEYHRLENLCAEFDVIPLFDENAEETIKRRSLYKIKLPGAILYARAFLLSMPLLINKLYDFKYLSNKVELINPFDL